MTRIPKTRWIVSVEAEDGASEVFGPWLSSDKADEVASKLRAISSRYGNDDGPDLSVSVNYIQPWPGIRAYKS